MDGQFVAFTASGEIDLLTREIVAPGPHDILVEAEASLISAGTERSFLHAAPYYPFFPGYSLIGRVIAIGSEVRRFALGDRVAANAPHGSIVSCHEGMAFAVPDGLAPDHASFFVVAAMAIYAVRVAELRIGDPVLIIGQGLIGLLATQIARGAGAFPVIGTDLDANRMELARRSGADAVFDARDEAGLAKVLATLPGEGVAAAIDLSGASEALGTGVRCTRRRGRVIAAALNPGGGMVDLYGLAFLKGISLVGAFFAARPWDLQAINMTSPLDWPARMLPPETFEGSDVSTCMGETELALRFIASGRLDVASLISDVVTPQEAPALFSRLPNSDFLGGIIRWTPCASGNQKVP